MGAKLTQDVNNKVNGALDKRIAEIGNQTASAVEAAALAKAESLVQITPMDRAIRDVSGINALSAQYKADLASLTQRHNEQRKNMTPINISLKNHNSGSNLN